MNSRNEAGGVIPMDYEWHGGSSGPVDFTSPFSQVRKQPQPDNKKRRFWTMTVSVPSNLRHGLIR